MCYAKALVRRRLQSDWSAKQPPQSGSTSWNCSPAVRLDYIYYPIFAQLAGGINERSVERSDVLREQERAR